MRLRCSVLAEATGGRLVGADAEIDGAMQDSRALRPGQLFVPLVAERDGHDFLEAAVSAGAAAYLTSGRRVTGATAIEVDDTQAALEALGRVARSRLRGEVVGVTGSAGKTSTKDLIAAALRSSLRVAASEKSFNNEIGVPLTLLNAPDDAQAAVLEMGARGVGHIAFLCGIARPTVAVVTLVAGAHLELFGSLDAVAQGKGELVEALPESGHAVLNADDKRVLAMRSRTSARVITYGEHGDVRAERLRMNDDLTAAFDVQTPWGTLGVQLGARGRHNVSNALAALAVAGVCNVSLDAAAEGLRAPQWSPWRMELHRAPSGARILNDAYNANPASMRTALESLASLPARRRVAVLGLMAELGDGGVEEHRAIAAYAAHLGIEVVAYGTDLYGTPPAADFERAIDQLGDLDEGVAVLVKGSRVAGLERLAARLVEPTR